MVWFGVQGGEVEKYGRIDQSLGLGQECSVLGDHLTVYDGPSLPGGKTTTTTTTTTDTTTRKTTTTIKTTTLQQQKHQK